MHSHESILEAAGIDPSQLEPKQIEALADRIITDADVNRHRSSLVHKGVLPPCNVSAIRSMSQGAKASLRQRILEEFLVATPLTSLPQGKRRWFL
jgi:hypothetical protein